jgi:hypothetical protein
VDSTVGEKKTQPGASSGNVAFPQQSEHHRSFQRGNAGHLRMKWVCIILLSITAQERRKGIRYFKITTENSFPF